MNTTVEWASSLGIEVKDAVPAVPDFSEAYARTARQVAIRAVILHGVAAVAYKVDPQPVIEWFREQGIWDDVTPKERAFLLGHDHSESEQMQFRWKQEAEWALLWMIHRVKSIGLPVRHCDTGLLVDEIMPALGDNLEGFISQSKLRLPGELLAEDDRTYDLWCNALKARRCGESLPSDLNLGILSERRYAFEWMDGFQEWDDVTCDS